MIRNKNELIWQWYLRIVNDQDDYRNRWIYDEHLLQILHSQSPSLATSVEASHALVNSALMCHAENWSSGKEMGLLMKEFHMLCPHDQEKKRHIKFYYWYNNNVQPVDPRLPTDITVGYEFVRWNNIAPNNLINNSNNNNNNDNDNNDNNNGDTGANSLTPSRSILIYLRDRWYSKDCADIFGFEYVEGEEVRTKLQVKMKSLEEVTCSPNGYKQFVTNIP